jgi:hypothetical protein
MKKYLQSATLGLLLAMTPSTILADQAIYKTKGTATLIGRGSEQKIKPDYGFWVLDPDTNQLTIIAALTNQGKKVIQIVEADNMNTINILGANGKRYLSMAKAESPSAQMTALAAEGIFAIGEITPVSLDGVKTTMLPKKIKTLGFNHLSFGAGHFMALQSHGVASLDLKASQESNRLKEDHEAAVNRISAGLKAKGYLENPRLLRTKTK